MEDQDELPAECGHANDAGRCYLRPQHYGDHLHTQSPFPRRPPWDPIQGKEFVAAWYERQLRR